MNREWLIYNLTDIDVSLGGQDVAGRLVKLLVRYLQMGIAAAPA